ncbi:MAG: GNAT family N-acetyltransferase [Devosiaceae bacterium]|nr:GNAT family N-acetyltransferase [Devosiaceae bacterium MH13]
MSASSIFDEWYQWAMQPVRDTFTRPRVVEDATPALAGDLAALHEAAFPIGWGEDDLISLIEDPAVIARVVRPISPFGLGPAEGFILVRHAADEGEVLTLAVNPAARGRGLGTRLLDEALIALRQQGVAAVFLEVAESNHAALSVYRRRGFRQVGERPAYAKQADGTRQRALVMRREYR